MSVRDRLRALGVSEERLAAIGHGAPTAPNVDKDLVADLHATTGKPAKQIYAELAKQMTANALATRPRLVQAGAAHVAPQPPRNPFIDAAARLRGKPTPNDDGDLPPAA